MKTQEAILLSVIVICLTLLLIFAGPTLVGLFTAMVSLFSVILGFMFKVCVALFVFLAAVLIFG